MIKKNIFLFLISFTIFIFFIPQIKGSPKTRVILGNENFLTHFPPALEGKRLGLVVNHTSVLPDGSHLLEKLKARKKNIKAIFSPEHGFKGLSEAGEKFKGRYFQGVKIHSLYKNNNKSIYKEIHNIDCLIYDIQDVGSRFYTYIHTLKFVLDTAAKVDIPVYILDRPNPAGGEIVEGPLMQEKHTSIIGIVPIPVRYGLTAGELALMMKGENWVPPSVNLHIIKMKNWKRKYFWMDTKLKWIPPSPNMMTPETAIAYPGIAILSALNLNEGTGTFKPFLQFGAPWLDSELIIKALDNGKEFGIEMEAVKYVPSKLPGIATNPIYENKLCRGIHIRIKKAPIFYSFRFGLALIEILKSHYPDKISFDLNQIKKIFGSDLLLQYLQGDISYGEAMTRMEEEERLFRNFRSKYLLYN